MRYSPVQTPLQRGVPRLSAVLQASGDFIGVDDAANALRIDRHQATKLLARWNRQGWIRRVRRGVYAAVPLDTRTGDQVLEDPWVLVPRLFGEAYIGGWSAAEHWSLTEQLFRSICVLTTKQVKKPEETIQGVPFVVRHIQPRMVFGTKAVWRGSVRVQVSSRARTIIDMLSDPSLGGGIRHVAECLQTYLAGEGAGSDEVIALGDRLGNGAVFKRLGFLLEESSSGLHLLAACRERLTAGIANLDPALAVGRIVSRWRVRIPRNWNPKARAHD